MAARRVSEHDEPESRRRLATTPEAAERQLTAMAYELAGKRIREGTASAQEVTFFLKMGSGREKLEQERLKRENELLKAKVDGMASAKKVEELMGEALDAFRAYSGQPSRAKDEDGLDQDL